jgi:predicted TIM-barrel fold metal-dependent hydrolase
VEAVPRERAERAFGRRPDELTAAEQKDFEDFMFEHVTGLAARYRLPFQIHTGWGQLEGSNPMLLVNLIESHPQTRFVLFHGGYP